MQGWERGYLLLMVLEPAVGLKVISDSEKGREKYYGITTGRGLNILTKRPSWIEVEGYRLTD